MKTLVYSFTLFVVFGLVSCSKENYEDREGFNRSELQHKEGEDEDDLNIVTGTLVNANNVPQVNAEIHAIRHIPNECLDTDVTNAQGAFDCLLAEGDYYFEVYQNESLTHTSGVFTINANNATVDLRLP
jgi:hypothetical protein